MSAPHSPQCQRPAHTTLVGWRNDPARYDAANCERCAEMARLYDLIVVGNVPTTSTTVGD